MSLIRPVIILLIFFGILFYFKGPLEKAPAAFNGLHSSYAASFKKTFNEILSASSTTLLSGTLNYIPGMTGAVGIDGPSPELQNAANQAATGSAGSVNANSTSSNVSKPTIPQVDMKGDLLPVTANQSGEVTALTVTGIVSSTNKQRAKQGLPFLSLDTKLSAAAELKLQDMFQNQYFEHVSPSGETVSDVVKRAEYEYIVVGENLALGIFGGDEQVVSAWMASPGHRKNILDTRYQDIGIAVGRGIYQGRQQWLIVQHFGKPITACTSPNEVLKKKIDTGKNELASLESAISNAKIQVDQLTGDAYTAKATEYNALVADYNAKLAVLKRDIDEYNVSARVFNTCAGIAN
jgi:uncharacterized protein YkwD